MKRLKWLVYCLGGVLLVLAATHLISRALNSPEAQLSWLKKEARDLDLSREYIYHKRGNYLALKRHFRSEAERSGLSEEHSRKWNEHVTRERDALQEEIDEYNKRARKYNGRAAAFGIAFYTGALGFPPESIEPLADA